MKLYQRHTEVPVLARSNTTIDANHYNHVQIALKQLGQQIRIRLPKLRTLDLILQKDVWVVVDTALNDIPIIAWTEFQVHHRESLHESIKCELRTWHTAADMIRERTLEAMELILGEELADKLPDDASVIPFTR